jgi:outer membrane biosynthesis protein TonB
MRRAHLCTAIGVALALMTPAAALADIGPVTKPEGPAKTVQPLAKPTAPTPHTPTPAKQPVQHVLPVQGQRTTQQPTHTTTVTPPPTHETTHETHSTAVTPAAAAGGRARPAPASVVRSTRTRSLPSQIAQLFPTRLAGVGHDSLPSYETWPSWVLGTFTLLASAEAFLLVRLARSRRFRREAQELAEL